MGREDLVHSLLAQGLWDEEECCDDTDGHGGYRHPDCSKDRQPGSHQRADKQCQLTERKVKAQDNGPVPGRQQVHKVGL